MPSYKPVAIGGSVMSREKSKRLRTANSALPLEVSSCHTTYENESTLLESQYNCHFYEKETARHFCNCRDSSSNVQIQIMPPSSCRSYDHSVLPSYPESVTMYGNGWCCRIHRTRQLGGHLHSLQLFSRLILLFALLLSVCTVSCAHKLSWESWSIEDTANTDRHQGYTSTLRVPDLVAATGHLFQYQITTSNSDSSFVRYQAREAGRDKLPRWLSFNQSSATFEGVPLAQDQRQLYITLDVYTSVRGGSAVAAEILFSINVVAPNAEEELLPPNDAVSLEGSKCQPNYYLSSESVSSYSHCTDHSLPVLANIVTYPTLGRMSGLERADIFLAISNALGICPHLLVVTDMEWSSNEGMKLWRQLAESGVIIEHLDFTTLLSFQLSCGAIEYSDQLVVSFLTRLDHFLANQSEIIASPNERGSPLNSLYLRWFITRGSEVLRTSNAAPKEVHERLRRQTTTDIEAQPVMDDILTTTLPEFVSSSLTISTPTVRSSSTGLQLTSSARANATISMSPTMDSDLSTRLSTTNSSPLHQEASSLLLTPFFPTPSQTVLFTTEEGSPSVVTSVNVQSATSLQPVLSSSEMFPSFMTTVDPSSSSRPIAPSSRIIPSSEPTRILTPSSPLVSLAPSVTIMSRLSSLTSSDSALEIPLSSIPVVSLMFSLQSQLTSLPILTQSVFPTSSTRSFSIPSSIDDLPSSTLTVSTFSRTLSSLLPTTSPPVPDTSSATLRLTSSLVSMPPQTMSPSLPDASSTLLLPETSTSIFPSSSMSLRVTSSDAVPEPTSSILLPEPTSSILLPESTSSILLPEPTSSILLPEPTSSILLPESTSSIILPEPTSSLLFPEPTSSMLTVDISSTILIPDTSGIPTTTQFPPDSSSALLIPSSSVSIQLTPTLSVTSELGSSTLIIPIPDTTVLLSSSLLSSSNNRLMPMPSSELTLSVSIFMPTPTPSIIVSSMDTIFPMLSSTPIPLITPSVSDIFPPVTSSMDTISPSAVSTIRLSSQITSSSSEIVFPQNSTLFPEPTSFVSLSSLQLPTATMIDSSMSSSEITPSFTISSLSVVETPVLTSTAVLPTETIIFPESTTVFSTLAFTPTPDVTTTLLPASSSLPVESVTRSTIANFSTTRVVVTTMLPSPSLTSQSPSSPPSPVTPQPSLSPFLSPTPTLTFCEENDIICANGTCLNDSAINQTKTFCSCYPDFTGTFCDEVIDDCTPSPCFVNGTSECIDGNGTFSCRCSVGYTGNLCEEEIDGCLSSPCQSIDSTCVNLGMGEFECNCSSGYSGTFCEIDIDPCDPHPCRLNETCLTIDTQNFSCSEISVTNSTNIPISTQRESLSTTPSFVPSISQPVFTSEITTSLPISSTSVLPSPTPTMTPVITIMSPSSQLSTSMMSPPRTMSETTLTPTPTPTRTPPIENMRPELLNSIGTLIINSGQVFQFSIPEDTFYDPESGSTSSLSLTLLNFRGERLPNTTWIQTRQGHLEGLPLSSEITNGAITDHLFILQAQDNAGSSAHDFVTVRVLPLGPFSTLFTVLFENAFETLDQNLTHKINLIERLSSSAISSQPLRKRQLMQTYNTEEIFVSEIFDTSPLAVSYKNLTISDLNCADLYDWIENIYDFTTNEYTQRFLDVMVPEFLPTPTPRIEGTCSAVTSNIPPTLGNDIETDVATISHRHVLLSTLIPAACVALCCLMIGLCALCMYRRSRSERKYLTSRRLFLNRRPIILEGEVDLPDRRRRPVIFENEIAVEEDNEHILLPARRRPASIFEEDEDRISLQEQDEDQHSNASSDQSIIPPAADRQHLLQDPVLPPPNYRLPPIYNMHGHFHNPHAR